MVHYLKIYKKIECENFSLYINVKKLQFIHINGDRRSQFAHQELQK